MFHDKKYTQINLPRKSGKTIEFFNRLKEENDIRKVLDDPLREHIRRKREQGEERRKRMDGLIRSKNTPYNEGR